MPLEPHELEKIEKIGEGVARIDERTQMMKEWQESHEQKDKEEFDKLHERVTRVRTDLSKDASKAGATSGVIAVITGLAAAVGAFFGFGR